jgi:hypothetical protein
MTFVFQVLYICLEVNYNTAQEYGDDLIVCLLLTRRGVIMMNGIFLLFSVLYFAV